MVLRVIPDGDRSHFLVCVHGLCSGCLICVDEPHGTEQEMNRIVDLCPSQCLMLVYADTNIGMVADAANTMLQSRRKRR
jgi:hypothetical protein